MTDAMASSGDGAIEVLTSVRTSGIAWIDLRPRLGAAVAITLEALRDLGEALSRVEGLAADGAVRLVVLSTAPPHPNLTGYDLDELRQLTREEIVDWSREAQGVLRRLEQLTVPSIAAVQSEWLGGAAELALACSYRVATDRPAARIGFSQTRLGLLPAWGGTVRLPRLIGMRAALQLVLTGETLAMEEAREIGLIDQILPGADFELRLERYAAERLERGRMRRRRPVRRRLLEDTAPGRRLLAARAARSYLSRIGSYDAGGAALKLISETIALPLDRGFAREADAAGQLIRSADAQGRLHSQRLAERARLRLPLSAAAFDAAAVVGAGQTGSEIAHLLATAGTKVRLWDVTRERVREGVARTRNRLAWERDQRRISSAEARRRAARVSGVTRFGGFGTLDAVIVALDAGSAGPEELLIQIEPHIRDSCLLAFCHPSASPTRVQLPLRHPQRVLALAPGMPADRFRLLEIVPGALTAGETVSTARRLARRLSLTGIVLPDQGPTPGMRLLGAFLVEGVRLLEDGVTAEEVDAAARAFGFEIGPIGRIDAIGSRRVYDLVKALEPTSEGRLQAPQLLERIAGEGTTFFRYRGGRPVGVDPSLSSGDSPGGPAVPALIVSRLLLLLINEAARIVEDGCVNDPGDLDVISICGLGFPRERGGVLFHAHAIGLPTVVADLSREAAGSGARFAPVGLLRDFASTGRSFFGSSPLPPSGHRQNAMLE